MSDTSFYAILFVGTFPAFWLLAWWLDRVWPSASEMEAKHGRKAKDQDREWPAD